MIGRIEVHPDCLRSPENRNHMSNLSHTIRKFNRFELKYMVTFRQAETFRQALLAYLAPDDHGDKSGAYNLSSLYYDGPDYRFYWEKVDGLKFRRKLRIRRYEDGTPLTPDSPVFVEIKQRLDRVTQKRRVLLPYREALRLLDRREAPEHAPRDLAAGHEQQDAAVIDEMLSMCWQYDLRPASLVTYNRQALVGSDYDIGLRVTFDKELRYRIDKPALGAPNPGLYMFPPDWVIIEIKVNERIPYWLIELVAVHNLSLMRVSKYCRSIEMARQIQQ